MLLMLSPTSAPIDFLFSPSGVRPSQLGGLPLTEIALIVQGRIVQELAPVQRSVVLGIERQPWRRNPASALHGPLKFARI